MGQEAEDSQCHNLLFSFSYFYSPGPYSEILPTFQIVNPFWKHPHRQTQKYASLISYVILSLVRLTMEIDYHSSHRYIRLPVLDIKTIRVPEVCFLSFQDNLELMLGLNFIMFDFMHTISNWRTVYSNYGRTHKQLLQEQQQILKFIPILITL